MLLLHLSDVDEKRWGQRLAAKLDGYPMVRRGDTYNPDDVRYIFVWKPLTDAFDGLNNLKAVLSLGAGVDALLRHPHLPDGVPIVRFVDVELTQCISDYVVANVTMHHRCFSRYHADQANRQWSQFYPAAAWETHVGIMGLGELGAFSAARLAGLGFPVSGWSRSPKKIDGIKTFAGPEAFSEFLAGTDILVNLLPLTSGTEDILNMQTFKQLRRDGLKGGPIIVNVARGGHQNENDIVAALKDGTLGAASLDVFKVEPLPENSALWDAPNCYLTPHIAAISNPDSGAAYFARVVLEHEQGTPLPHVIDVARGY